MLLPRRLSPIVAVSALLAALVPYRFRLKSRRRLFGAIKRNRLLRNCRGCGSSMMMCARRRREIWRSKFACCQSFPTKLKVAGTLALLSTEGDLGHETLQEVTTTLADALREQPLGGKKGEPDDLHLELASLVRYEHVQANSDSPQFAAAMTKLEAEDASREKADFKLVDLQGRSWHLKELRGQVVLINFWATWCPPCRKEMPDLETLYDEFKEQGFVVLAISDEETAKVSPFITERKISYPVLLDPGRKVNETFQVEGLPKSFLYNRDGKIVAQSIDVRTRGQFMEMLKHAGLQ
jgi:peroxiredoxin